MENYQVIRQWIRGFGAENFGSNGEATLSTDGRDLYSYKLKIGYTTEKGNKVVKLYNAKSGNFKTRTTSKHVSMAVKQADRTIIPE